MTKPIPHRSLEHGYRPSAEDREKCHWCSLPPIYHQNAPTLRSSTTTVLAKKLCPAPCVFDVPCDAPCHEVHWLLPEHHALEECPARCP